MLLYVRALLVTLALSEFSLSMKNTGNFIPFEFKWISLGKSLLACGRLLRGDRKEEQDDIFVYHKNINTNYHFMLL